MSSEGSDHPLASDPALAAARAARAADKARVEDDWAGGHYLRLADDRGEQPRGTVFIDGVTVHGYPHIGRILRLDSGLGLHFRNAVWVEEKIDGYNVRIARIGSRLLAFTRGGFLCPFTTDRLPDLLDPVFFDAHPELVLCAEVAGPDQPYVAGHPPQVTDDVALFVFDLMRLNQPGFLPYRDKVELLARYGLPTVSRYGLYGRHERERLRELLLRLDRERREGVVLKEDSARDYRAKYVTGASCVDDIAAVIDNLPQLPAEFFTGRILRLSLFLDEHGHVPAAEIQGAVGRALVDGLAAAIAQYRREHRVFRHHRCRLRQAENAERLLAHMRRAEGPIQITGQRLYRSGDYHVLEFEKVYTGMTGLLGHLLGGGVIFD